jgi:hypothetical protein
MTNFPTTEKEISEFADRMSYGYMWHNADFPHVNRSKLLTFYRTYLMAKWALDAARAQSKIAVKTANEKFIELKRIMKICLQKSEVDTIANPEKLTQIGWGPRTEPQPAQLPSQPLNLQITTKDNQAVKLKWDRPADNQPVRNYIIERRQPTLRIIATAENGKTNDGFSDWSIFQMAYDTQIILRNQPLGIQLEYRIRAANNAGTGPFSNTVSVIL